MKLNHSIFAYLVAVQVGAICMEGDGCEDSDDVSLLQSSGRSFHLSVKQEEKSSAAMISQQVRSDALHSNVMKDDILKAEATTEATTPTDEPTTTEGATTTQATTEATTATDEPTTTEGATTTQATTEATTATDEPTTTEGATTTQASPPPADWEKSLEKYCGGNWALDWSTHTEKSVTKCKDACAASSTCVGVTVGGKENNCVLCTSTEMLDAGWTTSYMKQGPWGAAAASAISAKQSAAAAKLSKDGALLYTKYSAAFAVASMKAAAAADATEARINDTEARINETVRLPFQIITVGVPMHGSHQSPLGLEERFDETDNASEAQIPVVEEQINETAAPPQEDQ